MTRALPTTHTSAETHWMATVPAATASSVAAGVPLALVAGGGPGRLDSFLAPGRWRRGSAHPGMGEAGKAVAAARRSGHGRRCAPETGGASGQTGAFPCSAQSWALPPTRAQPCPTQTPASPALCHLLPCSALRHPQPRGQGGLESSVWILRPQGWRGLTCAHRADCADILPSPTPPLSRSSSEDPQGLSRLKLFLWAEPEAPAGVVGSSTSARAPIAPSPHPAQPRIPRPFPLDLGGAGG